MLDQSGISVVYVSNQENDTGNGAATNVIDSRTNKIWYTKTTVNHPHSIILKTSTAYGLSGLSYTHSNEDAYGIITDYRIEISPDSISWDTVASGGWDRDSVISLVRFDPTWGNYVRLSSLASHNGNPRASAAQIHLYIEQGYKREQIIAFTTIADTVTYGDIPFLIEAHALSGLPVTFTSSDTAVISISFDSVYIKGAGTVIVTASQSGNDTWKEATDVEQTITVRKRAVFISGVTVQNKVYDGNNFVVLSGTSALDSVLTGDSVNLDSNVVALFENKMVAENKLLTVNGVLIGSDAANYYLQPLQLKASITPRPLSLIGISAQSKVYDGTDAATLSGTAELDSVLSEDSVELSGTVSATFNDSNANANKPVTVHGYLLKGPDAPNYLLSVPIELRSAISKAPLVISVNDATKGEGLTDPEFTVTFDGFASGEDASVLAGTLQIDRTPEGEDPGEYAIVPSGVSSDNYEISFVSGTLTIEPAISVRNPRNLQRGHARPANSSQDEQVQSKQNLCSITFSKNPVYLSSGAASFRVKVPCQSVLNIVIYDASGDMLDSRSVLTNYKGESDVLTWDLRNRKGSRVSVGTYLVQVEARGLKVAESYRFRNKLGVARGR